MLRTERTTWGEIRKGDVVQYWGAFLRVLSVRDNDAGQVVATLAMVGRVTKAPTADVRRRVES